ncbi:MAG TPA: hypothetical protein VGC22_00630, partial [Chitinophaga sp.]
MCLCLRNFKSSLLLFVGMLLFPGFLVPVFAQSEANPYFTPKVFSQSPTAAGIIKYGDYQVNGFSGVPDISIPLYEISSGSLKIPVTLSYHASGFKVTETASWVGQGWSVLAAGSISRNVMGYPDELAGGYFESKLLHRDQILNTDSGMTYLIRVKTELIDTKPDIFSYNFNG